VESNNPESCRPERQTHGDFFLPVLRSCQKQSRSVGARNQQN